MSKKILELKNVTIKFGGVTALDQVNFHVNEGEICALIGPNGAGKTTVFNVVTGVYQVTKGDIKFEVLEKIYKFLLKKKYKKKISYVPFIANMFYAGPQEAVHHANLRYCLGFNNFVVGRDHAGSENLYKPQKAFLYVKKLQRFLKINVEKILGSYFCKKCNNIVIKNNCPHTLLVDISGTEFRNCLKNKKFFRYADYSLQRFIFSLRKRIFL